jgi:cytosine deaminase
MILDRFGCMLSLKGCFKVKMDLILKNSLVSSQSQPLDIGIKNGKISALAKNLTNAEKTIDLEGRLVISPFCETYHIHLDKSCILARCKSEKGTLEEAIEQVALQKKSFSEE